VTREAQDRRLRDAVEAGAEITQALVREDAPAVIARRVAETLGVWECDLYEYDPEARTLVAAALWARELSDDDRAWVGATIGLDERPGYLPIIEGGECVVSSVDDPELDPTDRAAMEEWGELSTLAVPLRFRDQVVGCLTLIEKREARRFSDEDRDLVTLLAGPAAVAVRNARLFHQQEEQNRYLASLLETGRAITAAVTLEDSLAHICRIASEALVTSECVIYEYDAVLDAIVFRAFHGGPDGQSPPAEPGTVYLLDEYPSDREVLRRGEVVQETIADEGLPDDVRLSMEQWGEKACLNVPLIVEGEPLGILVLIETRRERTFGPREVELARALGEQAATAIRHARLYRRGGRQNLRLAALLESSRVLVSSLDVAAVLGEVRREVAGLFAIPGDSVGLLLRRGDEFVAFEPGATDEAAAAGLDELRRRAVDTLAPAASGAGEAARLVIPFVLGDAAEGLLDLAAAEGRVFSADELELLQILATQAAAALANAALYRTLEHQAITDGLTGLYNHRFFYERLSQEVARAQRYALPLSLLMIDIDDFKRFNDRFGHPAGDLVLEEVGRILSGHVRRGIDIAARYGGEEFVVLLPNTPRDGAEVVGARLARELATLSGGDDVPPGHDEGAMGVSEHIRASVAGSCVPGVDPLARITVSIGVACFPAPTDGPDGLVGSADKALYLAKRLGKNRVEVFGE
jgi:diguanylate cyclase (GGDEF)-like protein